MVGFFCATKCAVIQSHETVAEKSKKNTTAVKFLRRSPDFRRLKKISQKMDANQQKSEAADG